MPSPRLAIGPVLSGTGRRGRVSWLSFGRFELPLPSWGGGVPCALVAIRGEAYTRLLNYALSKHRTGKRLTYDVSFQEEYKVLHYEHPAQERKLMPKWGGPFPSVAAKLAAAQYNFTPCTETEAIEGATSGLTETPCSKWTTSSTRKKGKQRITISGTMARILGC